MNYEISLELKDRVLKNEESVAGRIFLNTARAISPELQYRGVNWDGYFRGIEDRVDSGYEPVEGINYMRDRIEFYHARQTGNHAAPTNTIDQMLVAATGGLDADKTKQTLTMGRNILSAIYQDALHIASTQPMPQNQLRWRNINANEEAFNILSTLAFNSPLTTTRNPLVDSLFDYWARYDALKDLDEDSRAGLILIPKEKVQKQQMKFNVGDPVPGNLKDYWEEEKNQVINGLRSTSKHILDTNMPLPVKTAMWAYFRTRPFVLGRKDYPVKEETVFGQNRIG